MFCLPQYNAGFQTRAILVVTEDLSLIIPWCNRATLGETLLASLHALRDSRATVIVINCGGDLDALVASIPNSLKRALVVNVRHPFNKSLCLNIGIAVASTQLVSVMDADIAFSFDFLKKVTTVLSREGYFTTAARVRESEACAPLRVSHCGVDVHRYHQFTFRDGRKIRLRTGNTDLLTGLRAGPGLIGARRAALREVGGFNSSLTHWGWEDHDIQLRLIYLLGLKRREVGTVRHITHSDPARQLGYLTRAEASRVNLLKCMEAYDRGDFQGSYHNDIRISYDIHTVCA